MSKKSRARKAVRFPARLGLGELRNMSGKLEILWTPITDRFITWGSEISLYEVQLIEKEVPQFVYTSIKLSETSCAHLLATNTNHHYVKSIDICPKLHGDLLLAVGLSNGRVVLSNFGPPVYNNNGLPGKELIPVPKHGRQCNVVTFNPTENYLLAAGLDKYRADNAIIIWDVTKINPDSRLRSQTAAAAEVRPLVEFGNSEMANSICWFNNNSKLLASGMNMKAIKLFDIRDPSKMVNSTASKAVYGVSTDPQDDRRLASFYENQVSIWDIRNFEKPLVVLPHTKQILKVAWCPTKYNLLGVLQRDGDVINLHEIHQGNVNDEIEPTVLERIVAPGTQNLTSFAWHSHDENRFVSVSMSGAISDYTVFDRITLNWAPSASVVWTYGRKTMKYISDSRFNDISTKMKERVNHGYGLENEVYKNGKFVEDDKVLSNVWNWVHLSGQLVEDGTVANTMYKHPGVLSVINIDPTTNGSETVTVTWSDLGYPNCQGSAKYYKHADRDKALCLCSWPTEEESFNKYLEQMEREAAYTRAAAIAVFNLKLKVAIDILSRSPVNSDDGSSLNVVAMALSGFSDDKSSVWRQFCSSSKAKFHDPYLKTMFAFLTTEEYDYGFVLNESGLSVDDRVGFACMYLPDNKLLEYLKQLGEKLMQEGNLDCLLLTGNNQDGLNLLQRYLDTTGDIQSTALIAVRAFTDDLGVPSVKNWIENYRELLDNWQMWHKRAYFDCMMAQYRPLEKPTQQVFISCNFCGKSISAYLHGLINRGRGPFTRLTGTANKVKLTACPNCRKPLPSCAICLMHMGTPIGEENPAGSKFKSWFTWCQSCRHGGHAGHMTEWFKTHPECPITTCNCKCLSLDFGCATPSK